MATTKQGDTINLAFANEREYELHIACEANRLAGEWLDKVEAAEGRLWHLGTPEGQAEAEAARLLETATAKWVKALARAY
jgi:hypothetical protein